MAKTTTTTFPDFISPAEHDYEIHESKLSDFVTAYYSRPWSMQQGMMLSQRTYWEIDVDGEEADGFVGNEQKMLQDWLNTILPQSIYEDIQWMRDNHLPVDIILWDLCREGVIPAGKYLIKVWW